MAKEAFYFSHDTGARNDPKLQKVLMKLGHAGKSVFWDLIEMLYEEGGYLQISEIENYAFALRTEKECIASLINDFDLFVNNGKLFWSESALRRIKQREIKSDKASQSAKIRWENANASKTNANALQGKCEGNAIKERKGKEKKVKREEETVPPQKEIIYPFSSENFKDAWQRWKQFRKSGDGFKYKTSESEQEALNYLNEISENNEEIAQKIINQSIYMSWKGLFKLKKDNNGSSINNVHPITKGVRKSEAGALALLGEIKTGNVIGQ